LDSVLITLGTMEIKWYSVLMIIGAVLALILILKESKRFGYSSDFVFNLCFWTIIVGIIGARAYYVLFNLELYSNWIDIFKIWEGGLAIHGGIIAGLLMIIIYCRRYQVSVVRILDFVVVGLILAQAIGRWGNFFNMEAHGPATTLTFLQSLYLPQFIIDGMNIGGIYYHPTFLYESLWNLLGFILLLIIRRIKWTKIGFMTAFYLMWYGIGRFFIESLRTDSLMIGGFKAAQIVSIIMFIIGLLIVMILSRKGRYEDLYDQEVNQTIRF